MPATAIPELRIQMTVMPSDQWSVACPDCKWFPDALPKEAAMRVAYQHNAERHDGAGVEFRPEVDLDRMSNRFARHVRWLRIAVVGIVAFDVLVYGVVLTRDWLRLGFVALAFVMVAYYAYSYGDITNERHHFEAQKDDLLMKYQALRELTDGNDQDD